MKCIQDRKDLQTYRTTDSDAARKVESGRFEYANRNTWKTQGRCR